MINCTYYDQLTERCHSPVWSGAEGEPHPVCGPGCPPCPGYAVPQLAPEPATERAGDDEPPFYGVYPGVVGPLVEQAVPEPPAPLDLEAIRLWNKESPPALPTVDELCNEIERLRSAHTNILDDLELCQGEVERLSNGRDARRKHWRDKYRDMRKQRDAAVKAGEYEKANREYHSAGHGVTLNELEKTKAERDNAQIEVAETRLEYLQLRQERGELRRELDVIRGALTLGWLEQVATGEVAE